MRSSAEPFEILDYTPDWDFTSGGSKLIVTCSLVDQMSTDIDPHVRLYVMFDQEQVLCLNLSISPIIPAIEGG